MIFPRQVRSGRDGVEGLGTAEGDAETGHDFVEEEEGAVLVAEVAEAFEVAGERGDDADVTADGFDGEEGDFVADFFEESSGGVEVVVGDGGGVVGGGFGDAGAGWGGRGWRHRSRRRRAWSRHGRGSRRCI